MHIWAYMKKDLEYITTLKNKLRITVFGIEKINSHPCIIFVHGFKGFKDWGFGPFAGEYFEKQGYCVIMFNFSHNGVGDSLTEFEELDKFANNTFSLEISELNEVIDAYESGFFGEKGSNNLFLIGHSRGGAITLLTANSHKDVDAIAVWSSVSTFDRYSERQKKDWLERGYLEIMNTRTKQRMRMNKILLEDLEENKEDLLNIQKAASDIRIPMIIVHGEQDLAVPIDEAEKIYNWANPKFATLLKISSAGHTFNAKHPFEGSNEKLDEALKSTLEFFNKHSN